MTRKIQAIIIVSVFIACSFFMPIMRAATLQEQQQEILEQLNDAQNNLEYVQEELSLNIVQIQELDDKIRQAEEQMQELGNELTNLQAQIDETVSKLETLEFEYERNDKLLQDRLVVMYEVGETSYLDILMQSANIIEFLSNYYTIKEIIESDMNLLSEIEEQRKEVEKTKNGLDEKKATLKVKKAKQEQLAVLTQNNKTLKEQAVMTLTEEEQMLQLQIEEYKTQEAEIEEFIRRASNEYEYTGDYTGGIMAWPIAKSGTYITSAYGTREHPIQGVVKMHSGIDIGNAGFGAPVIAAADGIVTMAEYYGGYGNCVIISHGNGISTLYGHGQKILTEVGKEVKKGDLIMEVGSTGNSTGPHVHFEVRVNGHCVDPMPYLTGETTQNNSKETDNSKNNNNE